MTRPERLIQEHELPEVYRMEHVKKVEQDELADGARRSRNTVTYDDGMSEEQWLQVRFLVFLRPRLAELTAHLPRAQTMEEDDDDPTTRRRPTRGGRPKKPMIDRLADSDSDSAPSGRGSRRATVMDSDDDEGPSRGRNKRARQSVGASSTASSDGSESDDSRTGQGVSLAAGQERRAELTRSNLYRNAARSNFRHSRSE